MDHIIQALERAKATPGSAPVVPLPLPPPQLREQAHRGAPPPPRANVQISDAEVSVRHLEGLRIVAHDPAHPTSKSFDILRTQLLQTMGTNGWRLLAVTSPTPGCGKTFTALNLALSIARQPDSSVLLVDVDLQKPQIAQRLGIKPEIGLRALIEGKVSVANAITRVSVSGLRFGVLPCERATPRASDWTGSPQMASVLQNLRQNEDYRTVILDLPPILSGDEALAIIPNSDCVLMVASAGVTKETELKECSTYLKSTPLARVVFNRAAGALPAYY